MNKFALNVCLLVVNLIISSAYSFTVSGNDQQLLKFEPNKNRVDVYLKEHQNQYKYIYTIDYPAQADSLSVNQVSNIIDLNFPCSRNKSGDVCDLFVNQKSGEISSVFKNIIDVNYNFATPVVAVQNNLKEANKTYDSITISFIPIFGKCSQALTYPLKVYPNSFPALRYNTGFWNNGEFAVDYLDPEGNDAKKLYKIDYKQLFGNCGQQAVKNSEKITNVNNPDLATVSKNGTLNYICNFEANTCDIYVQTNTGKKVLIIKREAYNEVQEKIGFQYYSKNLAAIVESCGSPCNYSTFVNLDTGSIAKIPFFLVMAVDAKHGLVAYPDDAKGEIIIANIYDSNKNMIIKRSFSPVASLAISANVKFLRDRAAIELNYPEGKDYKDVTEVIPLDYKKLSIPLS